MSFLFDAYLNLLLLLPLSLLFRLLWFYVQIEIIALVFRLNGNCCPPAYGSYTNGGVSYSSAYDAVAAPMSSRVYSGVYTAQHVDPIASSATSAFGGPVTAAADFGGGVDVTGGGGGECSIISSVTSHQAPLPGYTSVIVDAQQYQLGLGLGADFPVH